MSRYEHDDPLCRETVAQSGFAMPAVLILILLMIGVTTTLALISQEGYKRVLSNEGLQSTYFAAEGVLHRQIADMAVYSSLWDQQAPLATKPYGFTQYNPAAYSSTNGVPSCSVGAACQRNYYPSGGGLIKNCGPLSADGAVVSAAYTIADQLDTKHPPVADSIFSGISAWTQVERLDETRPGASTVGGSLSNALAEGGNAKAVRFRITASALRNVKNRAGLATIVSVVELPVM